MFTCEVCAVTFTRKDNRHSKTHNGVKLTCDICAKSFTRKYGHNQHKKIVHADNVMQPSAIATVSVSVQQPVIEPPTGPWDNTVADDAFLETLADFENTGKKIHYYSKHR